VVVLIYIPNNSVRRVPLDWWSGSSGRAPA
jgi:hypothetical protein